MKISHKFSKNEKRILGKRTCTSLKLLNFLFHFLAFIYIIIVSIQRERFYMAANDKLSEEDIKNRFITPAIESKGWNKNAIRMEFKLTDGKINIRGNKAQREKAKFADYVLFLNPGNPIAIVEAKDETYGIAHGLQQAIAYAQMLEVPFAYSSNGHGFVEHDFLTGKERELKMDEFPTYDELCKRFKGEIHDGKGLAKLEEKIIDEPYCTGQGINSPRYYQRNAINKTLAAIAQGKNRALLVMATGTGKTYTAFQIVYRLLKSGLKKKILYLVDRNILVDQSIVQDFKPLEKVIWKVQLNKADISKASSYQVYFALYQQLLGIKETDDDIENEKYSERYKEFFAPDFFDFIIVDECHRGSAKADCNWRKILEYFSKATQLGMTATPKETAYQSNIGYFGEPVYTYSLNDGIEDGFLAPFKFINVSLNISDGWRPCKGQLDANGNEIPDRIYNNKDFDYGIVIEDHTREVAKTITDYLKFTGDRFAKTIVFCANEDHADRMRKELVNENADQCKINSDYVVRITGSDAEGKSKLKEFISVTQKYPVIATTSKLLSTGVDCKMVKLIVLDQNISSMTEFKQIVGRGTRIREAEGKLSFAIMDLRNMRSMFLDPKWDGPAEQDENFSNEPCPKCGKYPCECPKENENEPCKVCGKFPCECNNPKPYQWIVDKNGCKAQVVNEEVATYDSNGSLLRTETIIDYTKRNILNEFANLNFFEKEWKSKKRKKEIIDMFKEKGIDLFALKEQQNMQDIDIYDFMCHLAFNKKTLTRKERANHVKKKDFFSKYGDKAREVLEALLERYINYNITEIEDLKILDNDPFRKFGSKKAIVNLFGSKDGYLLAVKELEDLIYEAA